MPQAVLHLVLRLRGGGWGITILMPNGVKLGISGPSDNYPISKLCIPILQNYPHIPVEAIALYNKNTLLDMKKTIKDYNINYGNSDINAVIPEYFFGSNALVKLMKTSGYWEANTKILTHLRLIGEYDDAIKKYNGVANKAMTYLILAYLKKTYPGQAEQLQLVYQKIEKYLSK